jgi:hypothetical protein
MLRVRFAFLQPVLTVFLAWSVTASASAGSVSSDSSGPRTLWVALDGSGEFRSIQEAIDAAGKGDTVRVKAGAYPEDVTIHSKEGLKLIGEGMDQVTILGRERVGTFHIGKWPYGATAIEISGMTINEHGGHALGIFNGHSIVLKHVRVKGMVFGQQVQNVRIEHSIIGGSETTGVQLANCEAELVGNFIHDNDHGVTVAGTSQVTLDRNIVIRSLFEGVVVTDQARAILVSNTIARNGGGVAFLGQSQAEASGNIIGFNKQGFVVASSSSVALSHNALHNVDGNYYRAGTPPTPAPDLKPSSDLSVDPRFVDMAHDDFHLSSDTSLTQVGGFAYLGALPPIASPTTGK